MEAKKFYKELRLLLEEQERGILEEIAGSRARLQEERARKTEKDRSGPYQHAKRERRGS